MNGTLLGKETTFPKEVEINCDEGFILRGPRRRKCQADSHWSGDTTVCEGNKTLQCFLLTNDMTSKHFEGIVVSDEKY